MPPWDSDKSDSDMRAGGTEAPDESRAQKKREFKRKGKGLGCPSRAGCLMGTPWLRALGRREREGCWWLAQTKGGTDRKFGRIAFNRKKALTRPLWKVHRT